MIEYIISILDIIAKKNSSLILKIFKGIEEKNIISVLKKNYRKVEYFKPNSSRKDSTEIYIIGKNFFKIK